MAPETRTGLLLLCCMTGGPLVFGFGFGWWLRARVMAYGALGAMMPKFVRERMV